MQKMSGFKTPPTEKCFAFLVSPLDFKATFFASTKRRISFWGARNDSFHFSDHKNAHFYDF